MELDKGYIGQVLLNRGFRDWFLYMFRLTKGMSFTVEPIHERLFEEFQAIYDLKDIRVNLNEPPRSGKTTLAEYFLIYSITKNPRCNFIYTSYSQSLLGQIANDIISILEHPAYKQMYPSNINSLEKEEIDPIDEFWKDYLYEQTGKNKYSTKKIITYAGGVVLFASIGSSITGYGAGIRNSTEFSGCLIIDDGNKPDEAHREVMRVKTNDYFSGTLLSRTNNSFVPIVNIQQRIHLEDLTGYLEKVYNFRTCKYPLLVGEECLLPSQYTKERIEELKKDNFTFSSQYQQEPIIRGGNLIKTEWFSSYTDEPAHFENMYVVCDTAFSEKSSADNTVFLLCGEYQNKLYLLDCYCKKVIFPEMKRDLKNFYSSKVSQYGTKGYIRTVYIENKGSGISLIQELRSEGLPISELSPTVSSKNPYVKADERVADKYTRFLEISSDLESGYVALPTTSNWVDGFIKECEAFDGGINNLHDDRVDCLIYALKIRRKSRQTDWSAIKNAFSY